MITHIGTDQTQTKGCKGNRRHAAQQGKHPPRFLCRLLPADDADKQPPDQQKQRQIQNDIQVYTLGEIKEEPHKMPRDPPQGFQQVDPFQGKGAVDALVMGKLHPGEHRDQLQGAPVTHGADDAASQETRQKGEELPGADLLKHQAVHKNEQHQHHGEGHIGLVNAHAEGDERPRREQVPPAPGHQDRRNAHAQQRQKVTVRRVHIGKGGGDGGEGRHQAADEHQRDGLLHLKQRNHADGGRCDVQKRQKPVDPGQVVIGAYGAGLHQKAAPQLGLVLIRVQVQQGVPVGNKVGELKNMGQQAENHGRHKADHPLSGDPAAKVCQNLFRMQVLSPFQTKTAKAAPHSGARRSHCAVFPDFASGVIIAQSGNDCKSHYPSRRLFTDWFS